MKKKKTTLNTHISFKCDSQLQKQLQKSAKLRNIGISDLCRSKLSTLKKDDAIISEFLKLQDDVNSIHSLGIDTTSIEGRINKICQIIK